MSQLDLHFYDGKINTVPHLTSEYDIHKLELGYNKLLPMVPQDKQNIINNLNIIMNDYRRFGKSKQCSNYDPSNDCYACELLAICFDILFEQKHETEEDFKGLIKLFLEQIDDMSTGICPPGRTTRLIQFIITVKGL